MLAAKHTLALRVPPFSPGDVILEVGGGPHMNCMLSVSPEFFRTRSPLWGQLNNGTAVRGIR